MKWLLIPVVLNLFCVFPVYAYRGEAHSQQDPTPETPVSMFPGYFDTNMAPVKKMVFEVPTFTLDYGVTENLTLGTNVLPVAFTAITMVPFLNLKARYRYYSNKDVSSTITGYGGGIWQPRNSKKEISETNDFYGYFLGVTNNTALFFDRYHILTFHLTALNISTRILSYNTDLQEDIPLKGALNIVAPGLGYQMFFNDVFGLEFQGLVPLILTGEVETPGSLMAIDISGSYSFLAPFRALMNIRTGKASLLSLGAMGAYTKKSRIPVLPFISWTVAF